MFPRAKTGRPPKDNRMMFNAILYVARSGIAWADIPERYEPLQSVFNRFCKWHDDGTLENIFYSLNEDADFENLSIDNTSVKAHSQSAGAINSENNQLSGVLSEAVKIYAVVDRLGNPLQFILSGGQLHDSKVTISLLSEIEISESNILADQAYGTDQIRMYI